MPGHICDLASVGKFAGTEQVQPTDGDMIGIEAAQLPMPGQLKMKQDEPQTRENIRFSARSLKEFFKSNAPAGFQVSPWDRVQVKWA